MENLQYPIGPFVYQPYDAVTRDAYIGTIRNLPGELRVLTKAFTAAMWEKAYRPGGWAARQVLHHIADSHLNAYLRFKLVLTEADPVFKPYDEKAWAELADGKNAPVAASLSIIEGLHQRWAFLLESAEDQDWERSGYHPEQGRQISLAELLAHYAWHCRHHLAHLKLATE